jgi:dihydrofolate reductase
MDLGIVVAVDSKNGIGKDGDLPWGRIRGDMKHFLNTTTSGSTQERQNAIVMGRRTAESMRELLPLRDRVNIVLTSKQSRSNGVIYARTMQEALEIAAGRNCPRAFAIGGSLVYRESFRMPEFTALHVTEIDGDYDCDTFFPEIPSDFEKTSQTPYMRSEGKDSKIVRYRFVTYNRSGRK